MAARGTRNMDSGEEEVEDDRVRGRLRLQAGRVHRRALIVAVVLTLLVVFLP